MEITQIQIKNIKGIKEKIFNLNLKPNKPNILVAPNGFGKSSFAIAFDSLKSNKIELDEKNYYNNSQENRPALSIKINTESDVLVADDTQNTISQHFDIFVINNQTEPKSEVKRYAGRTVKKSSLDIKKTVLIPTIPQKVEFNYSSKRMKDNFGKNGCELLSNVSNLFTCGRLFWELENEIDFKQLENKKYQTLIANSVTQINEQEGTKKSIKRWIEEYILPPIEELEEYSKLSCIIKSFQFKEITNDTDLFLTVWQLLTIKKELGLNFKKACKYLYYLDKKEYYTKTIESLNPVKKRFDIKPSKDKNSLVINWPKAHEMSNGERDILTFSALLLKVENCFKQKDCILIIDEIFDYMDDANLITFQYYISTFIDKMKKVKRRIFPILLTHLDPHFFNHFCFNDSKINVCYIKGTNIKQNQQILKLIYQRANITIQEDVDAYFFHYHNNTTEIDLTKKFQSLGINKDWGKPEAFLKKINREIRRYLCEESTFDPLAICFAVRIKIEELVYNLIPATENQHTFINRHGTKKKLLFAHSIGVSIPETYFLLGIIYNTSLHLTEGQDVSKPLGLKLENNTIKQMISDIFE